MSEGNRKINIILLAEGIFICITILSLIITYEMYGNALAGTLLHSNLFYILGVLILPCTLLMLSLGSKKCKEGK